MYALALGHEDLNDHGELRHDPALQTATSRIENPGESVDVVSPGAACGSGDGGGAVHQALFESFVKAHATPPRRLVLDIDATDTPLHGEQEGRFFHTYYDT